MRIVHSLGHVIGGTLLVAGTTIGVGMLALPVATGSAGFFPSFVTYIVCWLFMLATGLAIVEVNLSMPKDTSFISMAERVLGPIGKNIFWVAYLFLFTSVMIAHVAGGGEILQYHLLVALSRMGFCIYLRPSLCPRYLSGNQMGTPAKYTIDLRSNRFLPEFCRRFRLLSATAPAQARQLGKNLVCFPNFVHCVHLPDHYPHAYVLLEAKRA